MKTSLHLVFVAVAFVISTVLCGHGGPAVKMASLPLYFEANVGQTDPVVRFLSHGRGYTLGLSPTGAVLTVSRFELDETSPLVRGVRDATSHSSMSVGSDSQGQLEAAPLGTGLIRMEFIGADPSARMTGLAELAGKANYFRGNDPMNWRTNVATYSKVQCEQIYPGIDLIFYGSSQQQLEFDFMVAPGRNPGAITLAVAGPDKVELDETGDLVLQTVGGPIRLRKPVIYQLFDGSRREVSGGFLIKPAGTTQSRQDKQLAEGEGHRIPGLSSGLRSMVDRPSTLVTFAIGAYDVSKPLIIDPVLVYSTYLGGGRIGEGFNFDRANGIAVDAEGNAYVTGATSSPNFPLANPYQDALDSNPWVWNAFVVKLSPDGSNLVYSTYLGGSGQSEGYGIAVDTDGCAYVTGYNWGGSFPLVNPLPDDYAATGQAFVAKLNPTGDALLYCTLLGGSGNDSGQGIALDSAGNAYVLGSTDSTNFPTVNALQPTFGGIASHWPPSTPGDCFVAKLNATCTGLIYSTYLGGSMDDAPLGLAVDAGGNAYVAICTGSTNLPTTAGSFQPAFGGGDTDVYVCKINPTGLALGYSTYLGGSGDECIFGGGLRVDAQGCAYIGGTTRSTNFPTTAAAFLPCKRDPSFNIFVTKLSADGSGLIYSTFVPGVDCYGLAVDGAGCAYVVGDFWYNGPMGGLTGYFGQAKNPVQASPGGLYDAWILKLDADGSAVIYSTFLGGSDVDQANAAAVDTAGDVYVVGRTSSTNFLTVNAFQGTNGGGDDAFVAKLATDPDVTPPGLVAAYTHSDPTVVEVLFSESVDLATAADPANYAINQGVVVTAAAMGANTRTVRLTTTPLPAGVDCLLTVNQVHDRALPVGNAIATNSSILIIRTQGLITRKFFWDVPGGTVASLTNYAGFPASPDRVDYPAVLEVPVDIHARTDAAYQPPPIEPGQDFFSVDDYDNYGVQLQGYLTPPMTGEYVFYLCSDRQGALFLSPDDDPAHQLLIAFEPSGNPPRQWINGLNQDTRGTPPQNVSAPTQLVAGRKYYLQALMKKDTAGGDYLGVMWLKPGDAEVVNGTAPISSEYLSAFCSSGSVVVTNQPLSQTVGERQPAVFGVGVDGTPPYFFQWLKNGVSVAGATNAALSISAAGSSDDGSIFSVTVSNLFSAVTSSDALLNVIPDTTAPTLVSAEGNPGLDKITLQFSEPINPQDATNLANYAVSGGLVVTGAALRLDRKTVILATTAQTEGMQYSVTVNAIRDIAAGGSMILTNSQIAFLAWVPEEFVGPFASWGDLKRAYGAVGDGVADDTAALQKALDEVGTPGHPLVLYVPAGTYRITAELVLKYRNGIGLIGEHPDTTIIKWDGPQDGIMLLSNGVTEHRVARLTFDGSGRALSGIDHKWDGSNQPFATTSSEYTDMAFEDLQYGIRAGVLFNDDSVSVQRCRFSRCSQAGIITQSYNVLSWFARYCTFEDCYVGVSDGMPGVFGAGACHVYNCLFRNSSGADVWRGNPAGGYYSLRYNTSINSRAFHWSASGSWNGEGLTLQGNTIIDPQSDWVIRVENYGPLLLLDNVIRSGPGTKVGPVATVWDSLVSVGNTFTASNAVSSWRAISVDDKVVDRESLDLPVPELPGPLTNRHRPIIEVSSGATATEIQEAIDQANQLQGQRPVVHLAAGQYRVDRTITIPAGCDVQLTGDGYFPFYGTMLMWSGEGDGPVLRLAGPSRATLRDFEVHVHASTHGILVDNCDQPGARVFMDQANTRQMQTGLLVDRLDHTDVSLDSAEVEGLQYAVRVIGGPRRALGEAVEGRVDIFGASCGGDEISYEVQNGGRLMAQDVWFEGGNPRFMHCTDSGTFTLHGAFICTSDPDHGGTNIVIPSVEVDGFSGKLCFLATVFAGNWMEVTGRGDQTQVLLLGTTGSPYQGSAPDEPYLVNRTPNAVVSHLASLTGTVSPPLEVPDIGPADPLFIREMLDQTRTEKPKPLTPIPAGITDVRFYRVWVQGWADSQGVGIGLGGKNNPPVLGAVPDQSIDEGQTLIVTNTATDADLPFNTLTFSLAPGSPVGASIDPTNGVFTWTPDAARGPSTNTISVIVTDNGWPPLSDTNTFTVVVREVNQPPVLPVIARQTVNELTLLTVTNTASEANPHATVDYALLNPPAGAVIDSHGVMTWTPSQAESPSTNTTTTIAISTDSLDLVNPTLTATNSFQVIVREVNQPPVLASIPRQTINELALLTVTNTASDANLHATVGYALVNPPAGASIASNGVITWTPSQAESPGTNTISTIATSTDSLDLVNPTLTATNSFNVVVREVNQPPVLASIPAQTVNELTMLTVTNIASEANIHATLTYALVNPPTGAGIAANGVITWTPSEAQGPGTNVITTVATSTNLFDLVNPTLSATNSFTVVVNEVNTPPVIGAINDLTVNPGQTVGLAVPATDSDIPTNTLTFALLASPPGMTLNATSGWLAW